MKCVPASKSITTCGRKNAIWSCIVVAAIAAFILSRAAAWTAEPLTIAGDFKKVEPIAFSANALKAWTIVAGRWEVQPRSEGQPPGMILVQRAVDNDFNLAISSGPPYADVDVSVRFKPLSGREDASGGIVFRFESSQYYLIRANALEDNFRLYYFDGTRHQLASARVVPPTLGQWHELRVVAAGPRIQGYLDGRLLLNGRDGRLKRGRIGLWTKADSVTAFDMLTVRGVPAER